MGMNAIIIGLVSPTITFMSVVVAYRAFRSSTDPHVIAYGDMDSKGRPFVSLVIENVGNRPAYDITFVTSKALPVGAHNLENVVPLMRYGPIVDGIPILAPKQRIEIFVGQYSKLNEYLDGKPISLTIDYRWGGRQFSNVCVFDHRPLCFADCSGSAEKSQ